PPRARTWFRRASRTHPPCSCSRTARRSGSPPVHLPAGSSYRWSTSRPIPIRTDRGRGTRARRAGSLSTRSCPSRYRSRSRARPGVFRRHHERGHKRSVPPAAAPARIHTGGASWRFQRDLDLMRHPVAEIGAELVGPLRLVLRLPAVLIDPDAGLVLEDQVRVVAGLVARVLHRALDGVRDLRDQEARHEVRDPGARAGQLEADRIRAADPEDGAVVRTDRLEEE